MFEHVQHKYQIKFADMVPQIFDRVRNKLNTSRKHMIAMLDDFLGQIDRMHLHPARTQLFQQFTFSRPNFQAVHRGALHQVRGVIVLQPRKLALMRARRLRSFA
jgi:hypothetical protein